MYCGGWIKKSFSALLPGRGFCESKTKMMYRHIGLTAHEFSGPLDTVEEVHDSRL
jgi:hypothetical protein